MHIVVYFIVMIGSVFFHTVDAMRLPTDEEFIAQLNDITFNVSSESSDDKERSSNKKDVNLVDEYLDDFCIFFGRYKEFWMWRQEQYKERTTLMKPTDYTSFKKFAFLAKDAQLFLEHTLLSYDKDDKISDMLHNAYVAAPEALIRLCIYVKYALVRMAAKGLIKLPTHIYAYIATCLQKEFKDITEIAFCCDKFGIYLQRKQRAFEDDYKQCALKLRKESSLLFDALFSHEWAYLDLLR